MIIDFEKILDTYLEREQKQKDIGRYYPSEIGNCLRKIWFSYKKPKEIDKETIKVFHVGNILHSFISEVLKNDKSAQVKLVEPEVPFRMSFGDNFTISGRVDEVLVVIMNGQKIAIEVKSTKSLASIKEASLPHKMQLQLYLHALRIKHGIVLYIEKHSLLIKQYDVEYDPLFVETILDRFQILDASLKANMIPEPEAKLDEKMKWMCRFCDYSEECNGQ
jgi:CRISPR/Cas system-associated exonuclease Cas4 (RecB family)